VSLCGSSCSIIYFTGFVRSLRAYASFLCLPLPPPPSPFAPQLSLAPVLFKRPIVSFSFSHSLFSLLLLFFFSFILCLQLIPRNKQLLFFSFIPFSPKTSPWLLKRQFALDAIVPSGETRSRLPSNWSLSRARTSITWWPTTLPVKSPTTSNFETRAPVILVIGFLT